VLDPQNTRAWLKSYGCHRLVWTDSADNELENQIFQWESREPVAPPIRGHVWIISRWNISARGQKSALGH